MKAVIPAAGLGTRMLPATKSVPKELIPFEGKPAIQWVMEEALASGLNEFVVVVSPRKLALVDYLTPLETGHPLKAHPALQSLERLLSESTIELIVQPEPGGLGDALLCCRDSLRDQDFALLLPDNIFNKGSSPVPLLRTLHLETRKACLALHRPRGAGLRDGPVIAQLIEENLYRIERVLEKGTAVVEDSGLRALGRSLLVPRVWEFLSPAAGSEFDEVSGLDGLARDGMLLGVLLTGDFVHLGASAC
jgi:UTP--glucose-1-phosphate uridylyltransferase